MSCHQTRQLISAYSDQELTGQQMLEIRAHLRLCPECEREWREINDVRRLLRTLSPPALPQGVEDNLTARLRCEGTLVSVFPPAFTLSGLPALWREPSAPVRRSQGRLIVYAAALSTVALLAVAAPFAPSGGDASGAAPVSHPYGRTPPEPAARVSVNDDFLPSIRFTAGAASSVEADPLRDETITGYVQGEATMAGLQTSDTGTH